MGRIEMPSRPRPGAVRRPISGRDAVVTAVTIAPMVRGSGPSLPPVRRRPNQSKKKHRKTCCAGWRERRDAALDGDLLGRHPCAVLRLGGPRRSLVPAWRCCRYSYLHGVQAAARSVVAMF